LKTKKTENHKIQKKTKPSKNNKKQNKLKPEELDYIAGGLCSTDPTEDEPFLPGSYRILK